MPIASADGLRPTPDRVRETLFNWLQAELPGRRCIDLFAGSGVLGFEALSRDASEAVMLDQSPQVCRQLQANAEQLGATAATVFCADALSWLDSYRGQGFDLVFVDPPYRIGLAARTLTRLQRPGLLRAGALVYLEQGGDEDALSLPDGWTCRHERSAGQVRYGLYQVQFVN